MSPLVLVYTVVTLLMANALVQIYLGAAYTCPSCGARSKDQHSEDCQWS
jgi:hypothetical protein